MKKEEEKKKTGNFILRFNIKLNKIKNQDINFYDPQVEKAISEYLLPNIQKLLEVGLVKNDVSFDVNSNVFFKKVDVGDSMRELRKPYSSNQTVVITIPKWFIDKLNEANKTIKYFEFRYDEDNNEFIVNVVFEELQKEDLSDVEEI